VKQWAGKAEVLVRAGSPHWRRLAVPFRAHGFPAIPQAMRKRQASRQSIRKPGLFKRQSLGSNPRGLCDSVRLERGPFPGVRYIFPVKAFRRAAGAAPHPPGPGDYTLASSQPSCLALPVDQETCKLLPGMRACDQTRQFKTIGLRPGRATRCTSNDIPPPQPARPDLHPSPPPISRAGVDPDTWPRLRPMGWLP